MRSFETIRQYYQQRDLAARQWKQKGGKVVGYLCSGVPEEMIVAAGMFPIRISGDPFGGTETADKYTEPFYEGFVRSTLNMLLSGRYDFLDYLIIPHARDSIHELYPILQTIQRLDPTVRLPELYLLDTLHTRFWLSGRYLYDRLCDLRVKLEQWSGETILDDSLTKAMAVSKDNNTLLRKMMAIRAADPPRISGVEALQIIGASMFILKDEHNKLLTRFLEKADDRKACNGVRLFVAASPTDNLQFYEIVESCGATIVAENHCWGNGYIDDDFTDSLLDPLEALAEHYHLKSHCPRMFPLDQRVQYCVSSVVASKAQGVIFYNCEWDYLQSWEYPDELAALKEKGIPVLTFKNQKYQISDAERMKLKTAIDNFVKSIHSNG